MENFCEITFCQQIGSNKRYNQDALFNGEAVFQYKLKTAEKRLENRPHFIVGVADGISNNNRPEKASKLAMQLLSKMESLSRQTIYDLQSHLSAELAEDYFGSATTFVAAEIDQITGKAKILSVGDSRTYLIDAQGKWQQITQDHSILSELLADFTDKWQNRNKEDGQIFANNLNREFTPNVDKTTVLCGDTTYLKVNGIWCYLAVVINFCNRQVVGWKPSRHHDSELVVDALHHAMLNVKKQRK